MKRQWFKADTSEPRNKICQEDDDHLQFSPKKRVKVSSSKLTMMMKGGTNTYGSRNEWGFDHLADHAQSAMAAILSLHVQKTTRLEQYFAIQKVYHDTVERAAHHLQEGTANLKREHKEFLKVLDHTTEERMTESSLRIAILEAMLEKGESYTIRHTQKGRGNKVTVAAGTIFLLNNKQDALKQIMKDKEVGEWICRKKGAYTQSDLAKFRRKTDGVWTTAIQKLVAKLNNLPDNTKGGVAVSTAYSECDAPIAHDSIPSTNPIAGGDCYEVNSGYSTTTSSSESPVDICTECSFESKTKLPSCAALGCHKTTCTTCWFRFLNKQGKTDSPEITEISAAEVFYCALCRPHASNWETAGLFMSSEVFAKDLGKRPLDLSNNHEANIWHFYKCNIIKNLQLLPLSMSPTRIKTCTDPALCDFLKFNGHKVANIPKTIFEEMKQHLSDQFSSLKCTSGPLKYANYPIGIHLAKVRGHYTDSITSLEEHSKSILPYILKRGDFFSSIKLVRKGSDTSCFSVVVKSKIYAGAVIIEYGGEELSGEHLPEEEIGTASTSFTWVVLEHPEPDKDVVLFPRARSNLGRFVNGVRADEQHLANVAVIKVKDQQGQIRVLLVALRDIEPGEHLLYFYGDYYPTDWEEGGSHNEFMRIHEFIAQDWEDVLL